jgi:hypothetical protein
MKYTACFAALLISLAAFSVPAKCKDLTFFTADNHQLQYTGRIDFSNPLKPRFWAPGVYIQAKFKGSSLEILLNDEQRGDNHNYIEIAIDNNKPFRVKLTARENKIEAASGLSPGVHTVTICKDTESNIGYIEFLGLKCENLLPLEKPKRKMEFIGDSITCGMAMDFSTTTCETGQWYDQSNAYFSYGPLAARELGAQWYLTAVSGIGLINSCCNLGATMPKVFDKESLRTDGPQWDFSKYTPDVVTICLGQNDGRQDSVAFCSAYIYFIHHIRSHYPKADIICLSSPMANASLTQMLKNYITSVEHYLNNNGDHKVHHFFFTRSYNDGCGGHPGMQQHELIAAQLAGYIKKLENW